MPQILIFGDSPAHGSLDPAGGWVAHLNYYCEQKAQENQNYYCPVYNLGISGNTSADLLKRFERETKARISEEKETFFLFQDGGNDTMYLKKEKKNRLSLGPFGKKVRALLAAARKWPGQIAWLEIKPVDEKRLNPIPWYPAGSYLNREVIKYNEALRQQCQQAGVPLIDLMTDLPPDFPQKYTVDGVHPDTEGYKMVWKIVKKFLVGKGWI